MKIKKLFYLISICLIVGSSLFLFKENKVEAAGFGCLANGLGNCSLDTSDPTLGWCSTTGYCMVDPFEGDPMAYSITTDPCIDGTKQCRSNNCSGLTASDGDPCRVTAGVGGFHMFGGCAANPVNDGTWSSNRCILCSGIKTESGIYGDAAGVYAGGGIAGDMLCEANGCGASPECDEKAPTWVGASGFCDASCNWIPTIGLSLTTAASPDTIALGGSSTITFKVTKSGIDVSGATVSGISVTSGVGNVSANSCVTNASGECTVTYNNIPAISTVATITATKATKAAETDSGSASDTVTVNDCLPSSAVFFDSNNYAIGDSIKLHGRDNSNNFSLCIYNPSNSLKENQQFGPTGFPENITFTSDAVGIWKGTVEIGFSCSASPVDCFDSTTVGGAAGPPPCTTIITCSPTSACSGVSGSMTIDITCIDTGTCAAPPTTSSPSCCVTNADCAGTDVCDTSTAYGTCQACSGEGVDPGNEDLCCLGLGYWDADGDGIDECTSACDPNAWFFCNPLRGSVETIVQAGETLLGYILGLIGSIALLFIIIAGMMYMTSAGNEERISSSKRILHGAVIGLTIALLAYGLLHVIMTVLGM